MELRKFLVSEFIYGINAMPLIGQYIDIFRARKVLIVTDPGIIKAGWISEPEAILQEKGIPYVLFSDLTPNPKDHEVMTGAEIYRNENCDIIIAIGGGSPIDCAKGIGIVTSNKAHINTFEGVDNVPVPMPPLICIPTTAGTAADISQFCIISNTAENRKIAIVSKAVVPDIALIDPQMTCTMDSELTAATGMDALVHAVEAYVSNASSPVTDIHAIEAIRLIFENLVNTYRNPDNLELRDKIMRASLLAGMAFSNTSLGIVHAMAHSMGGLLDLPHGICNALLLEHSIAFNYSAAPEKYTAILQAAGLKTTSLDDSQKLKLLVGKIQELRTELDINSKVKDISLSPEQLQQLSVNAYNDACLLTNPKEAEVEEIKHLYEKIF